MLALVVDIEALAELVSIGTLVVFGSVCASLLVWRHAPGSREDDGGTTSTTARAAATRRAGALVASCVAFGASHRAWSLGEPGTNARVAALCAVLSATCAVFGNRVVSFFGETERTDEGRLRDAVRAARARAQGAACVVLVFSLAAAGVGEVRGVHDLVRGVLRGAGFDARFGRIREDSGGCGVDGNLAVAPWGRPRGWR